MTFIYILGTTTGLLFSIFFILLELFLEHKKQTTILKSISDVIHSRVTEPLQIIDGDLHIVDDETITNKLKEHYGENPTL